VSLLEKIDSKIINTEHVEQIKQWMNKLNVKFEKIHDTSIHGFSAKAFHDNCDGKGENIVIVKVKDIDEIIGG